MPSTAKKSLVCVVDDDESIRKTLTRMIRFAELEVETFSSAEEYLESGSGADCACLILDVNLPGMSGIDLQQRLNTTALSPPIIFISADANQTTIETAMKAGAVGFLSKPFAKDRLLEIVRSAVGYSEQDVVATNPGVKIIRK